jgi:peptide deformylase
MAIRKIITLENPLLRKKAHRVSDFGPEFQKLVDDMIETLIAAPGVGLAAPQVGVPLRLFVARLGDDEESAAEFGEQAGVTYVFANPEFVKMSKQQVEGVEGCLSMPGWLGTVDRSEEVVLKGLDRHGKPIRVKARGWLARVFQHEYDHLEGRIYIDIAKDVWQEGSEPPGERPTRTASQPEPEGERTSTGDAG